jgi:hypothetical protein
MNKFVLTFSDFILNENNRVDKTLSNNTLYEENSTITQTLDDVIRERLRAKLQSVCEKSADADMIVGKSKDLIDAAVKVYNKEPSSNFFKENFELILTAGGVLFGTYIAFKNGKKIKLGNTLTNIIDGIKTKFKNPIIEIIKSKWLTVKNPYDELILNCDSTLKYIKSIENKPYYNNLNPDGKNFFLNIQKNIDALKTSFDEQYTYINDIEIFKKSNLKERLNKIKDEINGHKTIIKSYIHDLKLQNTDDLVNKSRLQITSSQTSKDVQAGVKTLINKNEKFLKNLEDLDVALNDILTTSGITKPSNTKTIDDVIGSAGKQIDFTQPPSKFIERIKKYRLPTGITVGSIYLIYNNWSEISEWFKDTPELGPTIDIINNTGQAKEYYVQQMKDVLPTFSYDNWFSGLNVGNVTFKSGYQHYSDNLKGAILYDLAQIIINELKTFASISMYGILEKTTQA